MKLDIMAIDSLIFKPRQVSLEVTNVPNLDEETTVIKIKRVLRWDFAVAAMGALLLSCLLSAPIQAGTISLNFQGLKNNEPILNYYNGGLGGDGSGPGPSDGIVFGADALALISSLNGGTGNFANAPNGDPSSAYFLSGAGDVMNVAAGFTGGFSFYYTNTTFVGTVNVYSGQNDTGTLLASLSLAALGGCTTGPTFCNWAPVGVSFSGTAESVDFTGTANQIGFDDITLGSSVPVGTPEPSSLVMLGTGLLALIGLRRRKLLV